MRRILLLTSLLLIAAAPARYLLVCGPASCIAPDGTTQPAGTALNRVLWDGATRFAMPAGEQAVPDDGRTVYQPPAPRPTTITAIAFLDRFTPAEQAAVQQAAAAAPATLGVGLTTGLAAGTINLTSVAMKAWMDGLVAAGAITAARETAILTP